MQNVFQDLIYIYFLYCTSTQILPNWGNNAISFEVFAIAKIK